MKLDPGSNNYAAWRNLLDSAREFFNLTNGRLPLLRQTEVFEFFANDHKIARRAAESEQSNENAQVECAAKGIRYSRKLDVM